MRLIDADMLKKYMINNSKEVERFLGYIDDSQQLIIQMQLSKN